MCEQMNRTANSFETVNAPAQAEAGADARAEI
jgi:hypothetical protein